jgi:Caspase domain
VRRLGSLAIVVAMGALGCSAPMAIGKVRAEATEDFPHPWGAPAADAGNDAGPKPATAAVVGSSRDKEPEELVPRAGAVSRPGAIAIVIGIETYRSGVPKASGAERDAALFADYAEKTLGLSRGNIRLLTSSDATRSSIDAIVDEWLTKNADPSAELFFFFAGHGAPDTDSGEGYLVPWDADPKYIKSQGIPVNALVARLAKARAKQTYAFIDACFSGSGSRSVLAEGTRPLVRVKALATPGSVALLTASGSAETTGVAASGHGLFSHHLLAGLNGRADADRDGAITLEEVAAYTKAHVRDDAARDNREQNPELIGSAGADVLTRLPPRRD